MTEDTPLGADETVPDDLEAVADRLEAALDRIARQLEVPELLEAQTGINQAGKSPIGKIQIGAHNDTLPDVSRTELTARLDAAITRLKDALGQSGAD